ncbi:MAG: hypothetical protein ACRC42_04870 [Mycoplasma sp.]
MKETKTKSNYKNFILTKLMIISLTLVIPMILVWVFIGELNISQNNWLVGEFGKKWGILETGDLGFGINNGNAIVSWEPFVISFSILLASCLVYFICLKFDQIEVSFISIIFGTWAMLFAILISGLLCPNPKDYTSDIWKIIVRVIIIAIGFLVGFFSVNFIMTKVSIKTKYGFSMINRIIEKDKESIKYAQDNKITKKVDNRPTKIEVKE